jgi:methylated-DNA-[protein]-cysteine S-methyltransferase
MQIQKRSGASQGNYTSKILGFLRSGCSSKIIRYTAQVPLVHMAQTARIMQAYIDVKPIVYTYTNTRVGRMLLVAKEEKLIGTYLVAQQRLPTIEKYWEYRDDIACFESLKHQLIEYFKGRHTQFSVAYTLEGTPLQKETWEQLNNIPYGGAISYQALARLTSFPHAIRAVATAVGCNPLLILLPCHRVVRSNGKLGGFAAGISVKQQLLDLEKNIHA